jgi:hypothetical protein
MSLTKERNTSDDSGFDTSFNWEPPDDMDDGGWWDQSGTYHVLINDISETDKDGKLMDGFRVSGEVVAGTNESQIGKQANFTLFNGKMSHKDGGNFARKRQAKFFVAAGILGPEDIPAIEARKIRGINLQKGVGSQIIVTVEKGDKYMDVKGTSIYHVDDLAAKDCPKNEKVLALLPADRRLKAEQVQAIFDAFGGKKSSGSRNGKPPVSPSDVNIDDI